MVKVERSGQYDDDLNRIVDTLNLKDITNENDLKKRIDNYAGQNPSGGFKFPFQFFQAIKEKWENEIKPVSTGTGESKRFDSRRFFKVQSLFDNFKDERKRKLPVKDRQYRRRVVKGQPKFEVKLGGEFVNFNKVTFVSGYSYERKGRTIRVKDHIRKPRRKPKRKRGR